MQRNKIANTSRTPKLKDLHYIINNSNTTIIITITTTTTATKMFQGQKKVLLTYGARIS